MSIANLTQAYEETRRLAIAGSSVASGDFRLKKLIAPLELAGAKAPVFAKVALAIQAVVDSTEKTAAAALLDLTTLLSAVLYTQGSTGIAGTLAPIESIDLGLSTTQTSARALKLLLEALGSTGSGRLEIIKDALERKLFHDLRLIRPALRAIDDGYPEIADLIATQVLPSYGKAIVPDLRAGFDAKAKSAGHARRLRLMHQLDPLAARELVEQTLAEGSKELKVAAIECLGESDADLDYLIEQSTARAKDVRAAALAAMVRAPRRNTKSLQTLLKALAGDDVEMLWQIVSKHRIAEVDDAVIAQLRAQVERLYTEKDAKKIEMGIVQAQHLALAMKGRTDAQSGELLLQLFAQAPKLAKLKGPVSGVDFNECIAFCMSLASNPVKQHLADQALHASGGAFRAAVQAAHAIYTPAQFFDAFHPLLESVKDKKRANPLDRATTLEAVLLGEYWSAPGESYFRDPQTRQSQSHDPRWLDLAVKLERQRLACALLTPNHAAAGAFLTKLVTESKTLGKAAWERNDAWQSMEALAKANYPVATELLTRVISESNEKTDDWYLRICVQNVLPYLPASAVPTLEALIPKLPPKLADVLVETISHLKPKSE